MKIETVQQLLTQVNDTGCLEAEFEIYHADKGIRYEIVNAYVDVDQSAEAKDVFCLDVRERF